MYIQTDKFKENEHTHTIVVGMRGRIRIQRVLILPVIIQVSQCKPSLQFLSSRHVFPCYLTKSTPENIKDYLLCHKSNQKYCNINIKLQGQTNKSWQPTHERREKSQWKKLKTTVSYLIVCRLNCSIHVYPNNACHHIPNPRTGISYIEYRLYKEWDSMLVSCISIFFPIDLSFERDEEI